MWFDGLASLWEVVVVALASFLGLVLLLRIGGKRTLTKMNAFDFIMTFSLGSALSTTILNENITVSEGLTALAMIILIQFVIAWMEVRSDWFQSLIKARPTLMLYDGKLQRGEMKKERISEVEVYAALRNHGLADPAKAQAVVLETDGTLSVLPRPEKDTDLSSLTEAGIDIPVTQSKE